MGTKSSKENVNILVLGSSCCGKTSFFLQCKEYIRSKEHSNRASSPTNKPRSGSIAQQDPHPCFSLSKQERMQYANSIISSFFLDLSILITLCKNNGIYFDEQAERILEVTYFELATFTEKCKILLKDPQIIRLLHNIWQNSFVQKEVQSGKVEQYGRLIYLMKHLDRIKQDYYCPTFDDILYAYIPTNLLPFSWDQKIPENVGGSKTAKFSMFDFTNAFKNTIGESNVSFDHVKAIFFIVGLTELTSNPFEYSTISDSIKEFEYYINHAVPLKHVDCFLIFNKKDIFSQKLRATTVNNLNPTLLRLPEDTISKLKHCRPFVPPSFQHCTHYTMEEFVKKVTQEEIDATMKQLASLEQQYQCSIMRTSSVSSHSSSSASFAHLQQQQHSNQILLQNLDENCLFNVLSFMTPIDITRLSQTNRLFCTLCDYDEIWKQKVEQYAIPYPTPLLLNQTYCVYLRQVLENHSSSSTVMYLIKSIWRVYFEEYGFYSKQILDNIVHQFLKVVKDEHRREEIARRIFLLSAYNRAEVGDALEHAIQELVL